MVPVHLHQLVLLLGLLARDKAPLLHLLHQLGHLLVRGLLDVDLRALGPAGQHAAAVERAAVHGQVGVLHPQVQRSQETGVHQLVHARPRRLGLPAGLWLLIRDVEALHVRRDGLAGPVAPDRRLRRGEDPRGLESRVRGGLVAHRPQGVRVVVEELHAPTLEPRLLDLLAPGLRTAHREGLRVLRNPDRHPVPLLKNSQPLLWHDDPREHQIRPPGHDGGAHLRVRLERGQQPRELPQGVHRGVERPLVLEENWLAEARVHEALVAHFRNEDLGLGRQHGLESVLVQHRKSVLELLSQFFSILAAQLVAPADGHVPLEHGASANPIPATLASSRRLVLLSDPPGCAPLC
mmetsp:Transcript_5387/g.16250  ORF Transcript_5387/g.16250 Transcript_5387/m.16250 type:complete len:350 (-) Transcript_5387:13-1062(-)